MFPRKLGYATQYLGLANETLGENDSAIFYYNKAINYRKNDSLSMGVSLNSLATLYNHMGEFNKALEITLNALRLYDIKNNDEGKGYCYINLGNIYYSQYKDSLAILNYMKALEVHTKLKDEFLMATDHQNIANIYGLHYDLKNAVLYYNKALPIYEKLNKLNSASSCLIGISQSYINAQDFAAAEKYLLRALTLLEKIGDKRLMVFAYNNLADIKIQDNKYIEAEGFLKKSEALSKEIAALLELKETYLLYANMAKKQNDYKNAYAYHLLYTEAKDSLFKTESNKQLNEMQTKYHTERKDKELIRKDAELKVSAADSKQKSFQRNVFIGGFVLMFFLSIFIFRSLQQNKRKNKIITEQKKEVERQKHIVEEHRHEILDSIHYAKRIQQSLLPTDKYIERNLDKLNKD